MANFHPSDNVLLEYSAGTLDWALSICVSAHLHFCPHCKHKVNQYNAIGGNMFAGAASSEVSSDCLSSVMQKIKSASQQGQTKEPTPCTQHKEHPSTRSLPSVIQKLIPRDKPLKWSFVSPALRAAHLESGQSKYEVSLHKIKRGGKVAQHDHGGLEVTMVLEGSFSDEKGNYVAGDYLVNRPGSVHRPMAAQNQDCLCISVVEAPVKITGFWGRFINPFLSVSPG